MNFMKFVISAVVAFMVAKISAKFLASKIPYLSSGGMMANLAKWGAMILIGIIVFMLLMYVMNKIGGLISGVGQKVKRRDADTTGEIDSIKDARAVRTSMNVTYGKALSSKTKKRLVAEQAAEGNNRNTVRKAAILSKYNKYVQKAYFSGKRPILRKNRDSLARLNAELKAAGL